MSDQSITYKGIRIIHSVGYFWTLGKCFRRISEAKKVIDKVMTYEN